MTRWPIVVACAALLPALAAAQYANRPMSDSVSAPIRDVRYDVTFMRVERRNSGRSTSRCRSRPPGTSPVLLSLPAWTPGAYEISNFSRWVVELRGDAATANRSPGTSSTTTRGAFAPPAPRRCASAFATSPTRSTTQWPGRSRDFLLFNGTNLFFYPEGQPLEIRGDGRRAHRGGLARRDRDVERAAQPRTFTAANYHDLVDMPFFVGHFDLDSARVAEKWVRLATYPGGRDRRRRSARRRGISSSA